MTTNFTYHINRVNIKLKEVLSVVWGHAQQVLVHAWILTQEFYAYVIEYLKPYYYKHPYLMIGVGSAAFLMLTWKISGKISRMKNGGGRNGEKYR